MSRPARPLAQPHTATATADQRITTNRAILDHYRGELAPDVDGEWIDAHRRHATTAAITAALELARHHSDHQDIERAIAVLEHAIAVIDPYNEALYAQLIRLHHHQDRPDAALRAFADLVTALATIGDIPSRDITALL